PGNRCDSPAMTCIRTAGVAGCGVAAEIISPTRWPPSTSTSPAFTEEPPTSNPCNLRVMKATALEVSGGGELFVARAAPVLKTHPDRGRRDAQCNDGYHDRGQGIDVGAHAEPHFRKDDHWQGAGS